MQKILLKLVGVKSKTLRYKKPTKDKKEEKKKTFRCKEFPTGPQCKSTQIVWRDLLSTKGESNEGEKKKNEKEEEKEKGTNTQTASGIRKDFSDA